MSKTVLNLFPARVPIGTVILPNGQELKAVITPEFLRALNLVFERIGGAGGLGNDDLASMISDGAQAANAELGKSIGDLQSQIASAQAELSSLRRRVEGAEAMATYKDQFRVNWERPGRIGFFSRNSGAFTIVGINSGTVGAPSLYFSPDLSTGFYRIGSNNLGLSISGTKLVDFSAATVAVTGSLNVTQQLISTVSTGTAPFLVSSTTKVTNLNADLLDGSDWASPSSIGTTTPSGATFTTLRSTGAFGCNGATAQTSVAMSTVPATASTNVLPYGYSQAQADAIVTELNIVINTLKANGIGV